MNTPKMPLGPVDPGLLERQVKRASQKTSQKSSAAKPTTNEPRQHTGGQLGFLATSMSWRH